MKKLAIAALVSAQLLSAAQPVSAADFAAGQEQRAGAFGGFRLRVPLDGNPRRRQVRAGLTIAPTLQSRASDGETRTRIGEGLEFGYRAGRPLTFSLAGQDLRRLGAVEDEEHRKFPVGTALLVVGGIVVAVAIGALVIGHEILENEDE